MINYMNILYLEQTKDSIDTVVTYRKDYSFVFCSIIVITSQHNFTLNWTMCTN